jgi:hypothetical protein
VVWVHKPSLSLFYFFLVEKPLALCLSFWFFHFSEKRIHIRLKIIMTEQPAPELHLLPEDREIFAGQNVLVVGGPDAHALSMAVLSAQWLEQKGASAQIYIGSPVIRQGEGATHSGAFFDKTLPNLDVSGFDRIVVTDIPLNVRDQESSIQALNDLAMRLEENRRSQNAAPLMHPVIFIDHHSTTDFSHAPLSKQVLVKQVPTAMECRLGSKSSLIARIGAICDREESTLPVTEEEMDLSRGFDAAVRPDFSDPRPMLNAQPSADEQNAHEKELSAWETRAQQRVDLAIQKLYEGDLDYFKGEYKRLPKPNIPVASGYGDIIIVDAQGLTASFTIYKKLEMAIENAGVQDHPYAIAMERSLKDVKLGRPDADVITIVRHWSRTDLPSVEDVFKEKFGEEFLKTKGVYGAPSAKSMRLPVDEHATAELMTQLLEAFSNRELPDVSDVRSVVMCGDPNSGKSVLSSLLRDSLKNFGVRVMHLDLDKAAPTPQWYLEAEVGFKNAESLFADGKISAEDLAQARETLEEAAARRKAMKRPWTIDLAEEAKQELLAATSDGNTDFVLGDIGGGRIFRDPETKSIINIQRLTAENARILEGTDAVIVVSNNAVGAAEWVRLIESGVDPETGVTINRTKPIKIISVYQSVLEGNVQHVAGSRKESGVITNLDRSLTHKIYNPSIVAMSMTIVKGVEKRLSQSDQK